MSQRWHAARTAGPPPASAAPAKPASSEAHRTDNRATSTGGIVAFGSITP